MRCGNGVETYKLRPVMHSSERGSQQTSCNRFSETKPTLHKTTVSRTHATAPHTTLHKLDTTNTYTHSIIREISHKWVRQPARLVPAFSNPRNSEYICAQTVDQHHSEPTSNSTVHIHYNVQRHRPKSKSINNKTYDAQSKITLEKAKVGAGTRFRMTRKTKTNTTLRCQMRK